jgi:chitodextrinase
LSAKESITTRVFSYRTDVSVPAKFKDTNRASLFAVVFDYDSLMEVEPGDVMTFDLPDGTWNAVLDSKEVNETGVLTWIGHSETEGVMYRTILTGDKKEITGGISTPSGTYSVRTEENHVWLILPEQKTEISQPEVTVAPDGSVIANAPTPKFSLTLPSYFRQGQAGVIRWVIPSGFKPGAIAKFRFAKNGKPFVQIKQAPLKKGASGIYWVPNKTFVTNNGKMEMCAPNAKKVTVCQRIAGVKVLTPYAPDPTPPAPNPTPNPTPIPIPIPVTSIPSAPSGISALATSPTTVSVSWNASAGATGYRLYRDVWSVGTTAGTSLVDSGLFANTTYSYSVAAYNSLGESAKSSGIQVRTPSPQQDTIAPTIPQGLHTLSASDTSIVIGWNASTDNTGFVGGYKVYRNGVYLGSRTDTSYSDNGLSPNTTYSYQVSAYDSIPNESALSQALSAKTNGSGTTMVTINMLVYRTPDLTTTRVNYFATIANKAFADSGVYIQIRIAGIIPVNYSADTSSTTALFEMRDKVGVFSNLNNDRNSYGADLVTFLRGSYTGGQGTCGIGFLNGAYSSPLDSDLVYSVASDGIPCDDIGIGPVHEWGHTMGSAHDLAVPEDSGPNGARGVFSYSNGYCVPGVAGDIMSYCSGFEYKFFSSPKLIVNGVPLGIAIGQPGEADNVSSLNTVRNTIAGFR